MTDGLSPEWTKNRDYVPVVPFVPFVKGLSQAPDKVELP